MKSHHVQRHENHQAFKGGSNGKEPSMTVLSRAHSVVTEIEAAIERKPRCWRDGDDVDPILVKRLPSGKRLK